MAKAVPTVRLHGKQRWPQHVKKVGKKSKEEQTKPKRRTTARGQALRDGSLPPARRLFALFVKANVREQRQGGRSDWRLEMKRLGAMWKMLPIDRKQRYIEQSEEEFSQQHAVMKQLGLPLRKSQKRTQRQPANDVLPQPVPAEDPVMIGSYKVALTSGLGDCHVLGEGAYGSVTLCLEQFEMCCEGFQEDERLGRPKP